MRTLPCIHSFAKEPYERDYILQKRPVILRSLLIVAIPHPFRFVACALSLAFTLPRIYSPLHLLFSSLAHSFVSFSSFSFSLSLSVVLSLPLSLSLFLSSSLSISISYTARSRVWGILVPKPTIWGGCSSIYDGHVDEYDVWRDLEV